jgi:glycosyltransferase involved in cell wall biosynthesis
MSLKRILIIEPYYGGSHHRFLQGLQQHVQAEYTLYSLPARKWKMRMQLSAPWFASRLCGERRENRFFDCVLCSTFVDVAVLRVLLAQADGWNDQARFCLYFHENQLTYPERNTGQANRQFAAINYTSALAADRIAFNSSYNAASFIAGCRRYLKDAADMCVLNTLTEIERKSVILYPGIDYTVIDTTACRDKHDVPVVVWNHRWEHDKNPEEFFAALILLQEWHVDFRLILLGQAFRTQPRCFAEARLSLGNKILQYGYAGSATEYGRLLQCGDIVVSTAVHEFFGMAVLEAVRAGCRPLLPDRLAYPELFPSEYLYADGELAERLRHVLSNPDILTFQADKKFTEPYSWPVVADKYRQWLLEE